MGNVTFLLLLPLHERVRKNMNEEVDTVTPTNSLYHCTMLPSTTTCDCMTNGRIDSRVIAVNFSQRRRSYFLVPLRPLFFSPLYHLSSLSLHSLLPVRFVLVAVLFYCLFISVFFFFTLKKTKQKQYSQF